MFYIQRKNKTNGVWLNYNVGFAKLKSAIVTKNKHKINMSDYEWRVVLLVVLD